MVVRYGANVTKINVSTEIWNCPPPICHIFIIFLFYTNPSRQLFLTVRADMRYLFRLNFSLYFRDYRVHLVVEGCFDFR